jgi:hypothetical protein
VLIAILASLIAIRPGMVQVARSESLRAPLAPREALPRRVACADHDRSTSRSAGSLTLASSRRRALYSGGEACPLLQRHRLAAAAYGLIIAALDSDLPRGPVEQLLAALF